MLNQPFQRLVPGGPIVAAEYNRLLELVEQLARLTGPDLDAGNSPAFRPPTSPTIPVKITGGPDDQGRYSGVEQDAHREDGMLVWKDKPGGLVFTPDTYPLYEENYNFEVGPETIVKAERGVGDFWTFSHCCPGGSGSGSGSTSGP